MDIESLRPHPLFAGLSDEDLAPRCAEWFSPVEVLSGSSLAKQDDFGYKFYVVLDGEVDVHRDFEFVARIGPGDFFGEMALLGGEKRNARVIGHTRCDLACMMSWDFRTMTEEFPVIAERIDAVVAGRLKTVDHDAGEPNESDQQK